MKLDSSANRWFTQNLFNVSVASLGALVVLLCIDAAAQEPSKNAGAANPGWKTGLARAVITPDTPVWLAGYGSKRAPDGKLHELWMKAIALEGPDGHRVVLITSDFQGVPKDMSDPAFARIKQKYGLGRADVMFTFSHNHCGPRWEVIWSTITRLTTIKYGWSKSIPGK